MCSSLKQTWHCFAEPRLASDLRLRVSGLPSEYQQRLALHIRVCYTNVAAGTEALIVWAYIGAALSVTCSRGVDGRRSVAVQAGAGRAESECARCGMTWLTQASASAAGQQRVDAAQRTRLVCAAGADGAGRERARLAAADRGRAREPLPRAACGCHRPLYDHVYQRNYRQAQGANKGCKEYRFNVGVRAPPLPGLRLPLNSVQS